MRIPSVADTIDALIYQEAQRGLALQPVLLNELRARTGILLGLMTAVTSFLGALVVNSHTFGWWSVGALGGFALAALACLAVLWPWHEWKFAGGAQDLIFNYCLKRRPDDGSTWTLDQVQRDLALWMEKSMKGAMETMKFMQKCYIAAGLCLIAEVACWMIDFTT